MIITNKNINNLINVELTMENCEVFTIDKSQILDLSINAGQINNDKYSFDNASGFLSLDLSALETTSDFWNSFDIGKDIDTTKGGFGDIDTYKLNNRIDGKISPLDLTGITLNYTNKSYDFYVEYDPVENGFNGYTYDYSNVSSIKKEKGCLLIKFGKESETFHRKDNDYVNFIDGYSNILSNVNGEMKIRLINFSVNTFYDGTSNFNAEFCFKNQENVYSMALTFENITHLEMYCCFTRNNSFIISQMQNGRYYVEFRGTNISFICDKIS